LLKRNEPTLANRKLLVDRLTCRDAVVGSNEPPGCGSDPFGF
jgi:hypothetical protein